MDWLMSSHLKNKKKEKNKVQLFSTYPCHHHVTRCYYWTELYCSLYSTPLSTLDRARSWNLGHHLFTSHHLTSLNPSHDIFQYHLDSNSSIDSSLSTSSTKSLSSLLVKLYHHHLSFSIQSNLHLSSSPIFSFALVWFETLVSKLRSIIKCYYHLLWFESLDLVFRWTDR